MSIKRGSPNLKRQARNYTGRQADQRLQEVVSQIQQQSTNALMVDSFEIKYYQQLKSTTVCTCKQTSIASDIAARISAPGSNVPVTLKTDSVSSSVRIDYNRPLFGTPMDKRADDFDIDDEGDALDVDFDYDEDDEANDSHRPMTNIDSPMSNGKDCGICYRGGFVPGYRAYGFERALFTSADIEQTYGYTVDMTTAPHTVVKIDPREGFVDYDLHVPKYFQTANTSIRNNLQILNEPVMLPDNSILTLGYLKANAGRVIRIRVNVSAFTHVVIEFDLGTDRLHANLAQMSKTVDWTLFDTLGNIQMILPPTIQNISGNDVVHVPSRSMSFKIVDVTYLRTAREHNLDWPVSTRILQPQESLGKLYKANTLR